MRRRLAASSAPERSDATRDGGVKQRLLGSDPDPAGGRVVTYAGWPLYGYIADIGAGTANGQALDLNGGHWFVLAPSGRVIPTKPSAATG